MGHRSSSCPSEEGNLSTKHWCIYVGTTGPTDNTSEILRNGRKFWNWVYFLNKKSGSGQRRCTFWRDQHLRFSQYSILTLRIPKVLVPTSDAKIQRSSRPARYLLIPSPRESEIFVSTRCILHCLKKCKIGQISFVRQRGICSMTRCFSRPFAENLIENSLFTNVYRIYNF